AQRALHDDGSEHVGEDVLEDDAEAAHPGQAGRLDVGLLLHGEDVTAGHPREGGDEADRHRDDHVAHAEAHHRHHRDGQDDDGEREEPVHHPHDDHVHHAAVVAGDEPEGHPDDHGQEHRDDAHHEGHAGAVDDAAHDVAAEA